MKSIHGASSTHSTMQPPLWSQMNEEFCLPALSQTTMNTYVDFERRSRSTSNKVEKILEFPPLTTTKLNVK